MGITNDAVDPISFQPEFKFCAVALMPIAVHQQQRAIAEAIDEPEAPLPETAVAIPASESTDMNRIDVLSKVLGVESVPNVILEPHEKTYLAGYLIGLRSYGSRL